MSPAPEPARPHRRHYAAAVVVDHGARTEAAYSAGYAAAMLGGHMDCPPELDPRRAERLGWAHGWLDALAKEPGTLCDHQEPPVLGDDVYT